MILTVEVSLYPLTENFEEVVVNYIQEIKKVEGLRVEVNGLSTQVFGEYDLLMNSLAKINKSTFINNKCVVVMKMAQGEKSIENLPKILQQ